MRQLLIISPALLTALALTLACQENAAPAAAQAAPVAAEAPKAAPKVVLPAPEEAAKIYKERCTICHGQTGNGDGVGAAALNPKPRAFGDEEWQKSVSDAHLALVIEKGGAAGGKSPLMPPNPDLAGKVELIAELVKVVRKFGEDAAAAKKPGEATAPADKGGAGAK